LIGFFYAYQLTFREIFFNFACLGEPLCALLMLVGLLLYFFKRDAISGLLGCYLLYFFALKTKEMVVTLPIVFLLYEVLIQGKSLAGLMPGSECALRKEAWKWLRGLAIRLFIPFFLTLFYLAIKIRDMGRLVSDAAPYSRSHPYFLDFSLGSLLKGYAWYWNVLLGWSLDPLVWLVVWLGLAGWFFWRQNRWALFWLLYVFVTFVPVIGMVNRRLPYYWYIPFLGVTGLGSLLVAWLNEALFLLESERVALRDLEWREFSPTALFATGWATPIRAVGKSIKAATYSGLKILRTEAGFAATIVLDV